ncbi:MAG: T9SS type A sorting domain-containing protein [Bacteroidia bacterium]
MKTQNILIAFAFTCINTLVLAQSTDKHEIRLKTSIEKDGVKTEVDTTFDSMEDLHNYMKANDMDMPGGDMDMEMNGKKIWKRIEHDEDIEHSHDGSEEHQIEKKIIIHKGEGDEITDDVDVEIEGGEVIIKDKNTGEEIERVSMEGHSSEDVKVMVIRRTINIKELDAVERTELGIEPDEATFKIAPNPVKGIMSVDFDEPIEGNLTLSIFTMDGRVVSSENYNGTIQHISLNVKDLAAGTYYIRADHGATSSAKKLIITE